MRFALALILSTFIFNPALAANDQDAVVSKGNRAVVTNDNSCVRTKWQAQDPCAPPPAPAPAPVAAVAPPPPAPAPEIALEKRTVYFDFNRAELRADATQTLDNLANMIQQDNTIIKASSIGYADRMGADSYNLKLSQMRAESVQQHLASKIHIPTEVGEVRGLGESKTADCTALKKRVDKISCLSPDRRVEIELTYQK